MTRDTLLRNFFVVGLSTNYSTIFFQTNISTAFVEVYDYGANILLWLIKSGQESLIWKEFFLDLVRCWYFTEKILDFNKNYTHLWILVWAGNFFTVTITWNVSKHHTCRGTEFVLKRNCSYKIRVKRSISWT